jgi:hypothetical protein
VLEREVVGDKSFWSSKIARKFPEELCEYLEGPWELLASKCKIRQNLIINTKEELHRNRWSFQRTSQNSKRIIQTNTKVDKLRKKPKKIE